MAPQTNRPYICCSACKGSGQVELPAQLFATLQIVRKRGRVSPVRLYQLVGNFSLSVTAMNNRLEHLRALGLVDRERVNGKSWAYFATGEP